jgi:D-aminopeptidase
VSDENMPRANELGIKIGRLDPGSTSSLLDIAGVGVGHATILRDEADPPEGRGVARTGVTAICVGDDSQRRAVVAGGAVLNGAGECTGFLTMAEWGVLESPIFLTSTMQVGRVYDAACELLIERHPSVAESVTIPTVAECDDSYLNDARCMQVERADVAHALEQALASIGARVPPPEGSVGAGTGMNCLGFKGGIGTASRVTPEGHTVGVLLLTNFGERHRLTIDGVPVGRVIGPAEPGLGGPRGLPPAGSCIGFVVTDAPVDHAGCERLARRVGLGLARTGSTGHHGSGEIFFACSTGLEVDERAKIVPAPFLSGLDLDPLFEAVVDATEESVLNSMLMSPTMIGRSGHLSPGLPPDQVVEILRAHGRLT